MLLPLHRSPACLLIKSCGYNFVTLLPQILFSQMLNASSVHARSKIVPSLFDLFLQCVFLSHALVLYYIIFVQMITFFFVSYRIISYDVYWVYVTRDGYTRLTTSCMSMNKLNVEGILLLEQPFAKVCCCLFT